jgi:hypothetical protein
MAQPVAVKGRTNPFATQLAATVAANPIEPSIQAFEPLVVDESQPLLEPRPDDLTDIRLKAQALLFKGQ